LSDRQRLTMVAFDVAGLKPVEAAIRIIGTRLLRQEKSETVSVCERRPARATIITCGRLRASVQNDNKGTLCGNLWREVREHSQRAGIGAETMTFVEAARCKTNVRSSRSHSGGDLHQLFPLSPLHYEAVE